MKRLQIILIGITLFSAVYATDATPKYGIIEKLDEKVSTNIYLHNGLGDSVQLNSVLDKPTIVHFSYFDCYENCFKMYRGLAELIKYSDYVLGIDYNLVTISINPNEDFEDAELMKEQLIDSFHIGLAHDNWNFYTLSETDLHQLTQEMGYYYSLKQGQSINPLVSVLLTKEGHVAHYFYGYYFMPMHVQMVIDAANKNESSVSRIKGIKYYYNYVPEENHIFRSLIVLSGILIVGLALILFITLLIKKRRNLAHG